MPITLDISSVNNEILLGEINDKIEPTAARIRDKKISVL